MGHFRGYAMSGGKSHKIRFGALITMRGEPLRGGELVVENGRVRSVAGAPGKSAGGSAMNLSDCLLLPGFVNAHCHLALSVLHDRVPRAERFPDWVFSLVTRNKGVERAERIRHLRAGAEALLRSGVTTLADYLAMPDLLEEYAALPFRQVTFLEVLGFKRSDAASLAGALETALRAPGYRCARRGFGIAPHAPYSVSPELYRALRRMAERYGCGFSTHAAEFPEELQLLADGGGEMRTLLEKLGSWDDGWKPPGMTPVRYLAELGVLGSLVAVHLNHVADDIGVLAGHSARAVFCPGSTRWFGRKRWMPVRMLLDAGVAVGLGTDSLASNESLDFLRELRLAEAMLPDCSRREILEMATAGGARALGLETGVIAPGAPADIIGLRVGPFPADLYDIPFAPGRDAADFVMIDGIVARNAVC
jgi:cytosine/adenosine deaminase-related metal-dependent hydrolase